MIEQIFNVAFITAFLSATVRMAVPILYAGLGEMFLQKAGILNIGMEGVMLSGAFFSFAVALSTGSIILGLVGGILGGILVSVIHGFLTIKLHQDQSVSGISINIFMLGLTSFLYKLLTSGSEYQQITTLSTIEIPILSQIPLIGQSFFNQDIMTYALYLCILVLTWFYRHTAFGLNFISVGENPKASESAGNNVVLYKWIAIIVNGAFGALGGAYLVVVQLGKFSENIISGRGYIALATVILGKYTPFGVFGSALIFGAANSLQIRLQAIGVSIPSQILTMLPYIATIVALLISNKNKSEPEALGKPYIRGTR